MKRLIKQLIAACIYYSGMLWLCRKLNPRKYPAILMYHRVVSPNDPTARAAQAGMTILLDTFERQMSLLRQHYPILRLDDYAKRVQQREHVPENAVIITFDDGWGDNYRYAWPVLRKHEIPATIFLSTDNIDDKAIFWFIRLSAQLQRNSLTEEQLLECYQAVRDSLGLPADREAQTLSSGGDPLWFVELAKRLDSAGIEALIEAIIATSGDTPDKWPPQNYMLHWNEIREMAGSLVEFGSHGCAHTIFTTLSSEELAHQLQESRKLIEREIGLPVVTCAYPNGNHNETIRLATREAGYLCGVAVRDSYGRSHPADMFSLQRQNMFEGKALGFTGKFSRALFFCQLEGLL